MSGGVKFPIIGQAQRAGAEDGRIALMRAAIVLSAEDNVAVARHDLLCGCEIVYGVAVIVLHDPIPSGHKFALRDIDRGAPLLKYSQPIGRAIRPIKAGEWVHSHNIEVAHELENPEFSSVGSPTLPALHPDLPHTFRGFRRSGGRVGTRNYIAVVAASNCASHVCQGITDLFRDFRTVNVDGVVALPHVEGCAQHEGPDLQQLIRTLRGIILNPNVGAVLMVGLGCEVNSLSYYGADKSDIHDSKPFASLEIQSSGGTLKTIAAGSEIVRRLAETLAPCERTEQPVAELLLGLNCGGSDAFSGITANPALGHASDLLISVGGTAVLGETPEIYGAEQLLTRRAIDADTAGKLIHIIERYQRYVALFGATLDSNPAPGNLRGGISNIVEKSLGAVMKGGNSMLAGVVDFAGLVTAKGLVMMDTPGYDPVSITGLAAGGCNLIAFTTGRGSAIGFPIVPVIKISSNSRIFQVMNDNIDINAGDIADGDCTVQDKGLEIYRYIVRVASGERTKSEILGHREFAPWRIGPVM